MKKIFKQINRTQRGFTFNNEEQEVHGLEVDKTYDLSDIHQVGPSNYPSPNWDMELPSEKPLTGDDLFDENSFVNEKGELTD